MKIIWAALIIVLVHAAVQAADKIRIATPLGIHPPIHLAQKKGFFKQEELDAEIIEVGPTVGMAALVNREIDYYSVIGSSVNAALQGLPVKVVACYIPCVNLMLVARPEFKSVQQLKGRTVAFGPRGTPPEILGRMVLRHFGIDSEKEIKFTAVGTMEARFASMKQGLIAAIMVPFNWALEGEKLGFNILANTCELLSWPDGGLVTTANKIKERPDEIKRVIKAGIRANRYILANRDGTIQFLMEWRRTNRETAAATYENLSKIVNDDGSLPEKGFRLVIEEAKKLAKVNREVPFSEVADLTILREAQRELGIKGK